MSYDSTADTLKHIRRVGKYLNDFAHALIERAIAHDASKLEPPEKELFDRVRPLLDKHRYGSAEYNAVVAEMGEGVKHHYAHNSHHPEHYQFWECEVCGRVFHVETKQCNLCESVLIKVRPNIGGMDLVDLVEMYCDWRAASERRGDVNFQESIRISAQRFGMSPQLLEIFMNTAQRYSGG